MEKCSHKISISPARIRKIKVGPLDLSATFNGFTGALRVLGGIRKEGEDWLRGLSLSFRPAFHYLSLVFQPMLKQALVNTRI